MNKSILSAVLVSFFILPSISDAQQNSNNINSATVYARNLESFNSIVLSGGLDVYISQSATQSVDVKTSEKNQNKIITEVKNSILYVYVENGTKYIKNTEVFIAVVDILALEVSGSCDVKGKSNLNTKDFNIKASGGSDIELSLNAENVTIEVSGASNINLQGTSNAARINISGASDFDAVDFIINNCNLEVSGASDVNIHVTGDLSAEVSGASNVDYKGNPKITSRKVSGSGSLDAH